MSQRNMSGPLSFVNGETTMYEYRLVKLNASNAAVFADDGDDPLGVSLTNHPRYQNQGSTDNEMVSVMPLHMAASIMVVAASTFSLGDPLYVANDGKVANSGSGEIIGTAMEAATAAGQVIEMVPNKAAWTPTPIDRVNLVDDFLSFNTGDLWTATLDTSGTAAVSDAHGGQLVITTHTDDNDAATIHTTNEVFLPAANTSGEVEARFKVVEANTDDANFFFGFSDVSTVDLMVDDGAGPATTLDGFGFYKVDGGTQMGIISSNATTQDVDANQVAFTTNTFMKLAIKWTCDATNATIRFFKDGTQVGVDHTLALSGLAEMHLAFSIKAGGGAAEVMTVDYVRASFDR